MPRSARKQFPGAKYHVVNRGNGRQLIFRCAGDYDRFLEQLCDALEWDGVVLYAYCLMPTHIHLLVETPLGNLDRFMGRLTTAYAMYFRYKHNQPGHCFQGRYKAPLVAGDDYILRLTRYIHLNPIQGDETEGWPTERKWDVARGYRWSSLGGYMAGGGGGVSVDYRWLRLVDARGGKRAGKAYKRYMRQVLRAPDDVLEDAMMASRYAIGDAVFRTEVDDWVRGQAPQWASGADVDIPLPEPIPIQHLAVAVADAFKVRTDALYKARQRVGMARGVLIELACTLGNMRQRDVARALGTLSEHAVSKQRRLFRTTLLGDALLRARFDALRKQLKSKV